MCVCVCVCVLVCVCVCVCVGCVYAHVSLFSFAPAPAPVPAAVTFTAPVTGRAPTAVTELLALGHFTIVQLLCSHGVFKASKSGCLFKEIANKANLNKEPEEESIARLFLIMTYLSGGVCVWWFVCGVGGVCGGGVCVGGVCVVLVVCVVVCVVLVVVVVVVVCVLVVCVWCWWW